MSRELGDTLKALFMPDHNVIVRAANTFVLDLHKVLEEIGHQTNLNGTMHGLTNDGETLGLGRIGGDNLITDVGQSPGEILDCGNPVSDTGHIVQEAGKVVSATGNFIQGIGSDLSNPHVVTDVVKGLTTETLPLGGIGTDVDGIVSKLGKLNQEPGGCNDHSEGKIISVEAGPEGHSPLLDLGVLTAPEGRAPISVDIGDGSNLVDAHLLSHADSIPDLCETGNLLGAILQKTSDLEHHCDTGGGSGELILDVHTDCGPLLQIHEEASSLFGVNGHTVL